MRFAPAFSGRPRFLSGIDFTLFHSGTKSPQWGEKIWPDLQVVIMNRDFSGVGQVVQAAVAGAVRARERPVLRRLEAAAAIEGVEPAARRGR